MVRYGPPQVRKEVPTLKEFAPRFVDGHGRANRQKPSGIAAKEMLLRVHLVPFLGHKRLDAIGNEDVQRLKKSRSRAKKRTCGTASTTLGELEEMTLGEGSPRSRFQVFFERQGTCRIRKLDRRDKFPGPADSGMNRTAVISHERMALQIWYRLCFCSFPRKTNER